MGGSLGGNGGRLFIITVNVRSSFHELHLHFHTSRFHADLKKTKKKKTHTHITRRSHHVYSIPFGGAVRVHDDFQSSMAGHFAHRVGHRWWLLRPSAYGPCGMARLLRPELRKKGHYGRGVGREVFRGDHR